MGLFNRYKVGHILIEVVHPIYNWFSGAHLVGRRFFLCAKRCKTSQALGGGVNFETHQYMSTMFFL